MARPVGPDTRIRSINGSRTRYGVVHGRRGSYVQGCRCDPCRDAEAAYSRARYAARRSAIEPVDNPQVVDRLSTGTSSEKERYSTCSTQAKRWSMTA